MNRLTAAVLALALSTLGANGAFAADAAAGQAKAGVCAACHGPTGQSPSDLWPNLAGQKAGYLAKQIKAFRDGTRVDPMMSPMVKALTDADIENLAAYYSSQN